MSFDLIFLFFELNGNYSVEFIRTTKDELQKKFEHNFEAERQRDSH